MRREEGDCIGGRAVKFPAPRHPHQFKRARFLVPEPTACAMEPEAADYVVAHGRRLEAALSEAVSAAIATRTADPVRYISEHLQKAATAEKTQRAAEEIARRDDFRELTVFGHGCAIKKTEERAISLAQLRAVRTHIERRCEAEGWEGEIGRAHV